MGGVLIITQMNAARRRRENGYYGGSGPEMGPKDWLMLIVLILGITLLFVTILEVGSYMFTGQFHIFNKIWQTIKQ